MHNILFSFFLYYDIILLNSSFQPDDVLTRKLDCNGIFLRTSRKEGECRKPKMHKLKKKPFYVKNFRAAKRTGDIEKN